MNTRTNTRKNDTVLRLTVTAMFCALAYAAVFVFHISGIGGFLTFDVKDAILTTGALLLGPLSGLIGALIVSLLEMVSVSGTGAWGALMNFVSSASFVCIASLIYRSAPKIRRTMTGAWCGLLSSVIGTAAVMMGMNLIVTPIYTGMSRAAVAGMILPLLLPFNLIKAALNAALVMILYKPLSLILRRSGILSASETEEMQPAGKAADARRFGKKTPVVLIVSLAVAAGCAILLLVVFGGEFHWFRPHP